MNNVDKKKLFLYFNAISVNKLMASHVSKVYITYFSGFTDACQLAKSLILPSNSWEIEWKRLIKWWLRNGRKFNPGSSAPIRQTLSITYAVPLFLDLLLFLLIFIKTSVSIVIEQSTILIVVCILIWKKKKNILLSVISYNRSLQWTSRAFLGEDTALLYSTFILLAYVSVFFFFCPKDQFAVLFVLVTSTLCHVA